MRFDSLTDWLTWQEHLHRQPVDLGLERVGNVLHRLHTGSPPFRIVTVAGTNGKGSSIAMLEAIIKAAGYRVGSFTSPHLLTYNERIRIDGIALNDDEICAAFARIDSVRHHQTLTYFEFGALAAIDIFYRRAVDIALLEVGMGGRLDAVNILDTDIALITSIAIDHSHWLGRDREAIAGEKAGILRTGRPAVLGDPQVPDNVLKRAIKIDAPYYCLGVDFKFRETSFGWDWWSAHHRYLSLPLPALPGHYQLQNAAAVLMVVELLTPWLTIDKDAISTGLRNTCLAGRLQQIVNGPVEKIFDVAHNPAGATVLAQELASRPCAGITHAVLGILADKDIRGVVMAMVPVVDDWYIANLAVERGAAAALVQQLLPRQIAEQRVCCHDNPVAAYQSALAAAEPGDRIVVFGSFYTVADVLRYDVRSDNRAAHTILDAEAC